MTNTAENTVTSISLDNYNSGEIVKKGRGSLELWGRGSDSKEKVSISSGKLIIDEGEVAIRTTGGCGGYLSVPEVTVNEGGVLSLAGGYNSGLQTASWTINGTLRLYTGGGETACGSLNGTGVITNTPWYSSGGTLTVSGGEDRMSAFTGTVPSKKVRIGFKKASSASDGYFKVMGAEQYKDSGGLYFRGSGSPVVFASGVGAFDVGELSVENDSTSSVLTLEDENGDPIRLTAEISGVNMGRLNVGGKGDLILSGTENATLKGSKIANQGLLSVCCNLFLGDGSDAANDFDFENGPRRIEMRDGGTLTINNVNPFSYTGTLAALYDGNLKVMGDGTIARVERNGGRIDNYGDLTINGGYIRNTYTFYINENKTLTLSGVEVGYRDISGVNFNGAAGSRLVFNGKVLDVSAYDKFAPMRFEQRGGEVRFIGGKTYTPPSAASELDPATYLFDGGISRFYSGTPFNSTALNLLVGTAGAKIRGYESAIAPTAIIYMKSPFKSGVAASATDGGVEIDARPWFRFSYPLEITGPFKLQGSGVLIDAGATFSDNTQFFGTGDLELDTAEIAFYPRKNSKIVELATGEGQRFVVKGSSLLCPRYRDPNSGATLEPNAFVIRMPEFGDAGMLSLFDRVSAVGNEGASYVKSASGAPTMSASGRVKLPILMGGKVPKFTTYDAEAGFMAFTGGVTSVGDCAADKVLYCNSSKTFAANRSYDVEAIYSADWAGITVPSTTTVRIGDAVNPGMVLMSGQNGLKGGGRLDFLGAKAMIVGGGSGSSDYNSYCDVKIMNAASVNYLASFDESSSYRKISLSTAQDYVCDTYVSAVRIFAKNTSCFSTGRVYVMGGMRKGGQIDFRTAGVWANDFSVRGAGLSNNEWDSETSHSGTAALSFYADATISGEVEIRELARLCVAAGMRGAVTGTVSGGRLYLYDNKGEFALGGHNTYVGGTRVDGGRLTLGHADSAGTGALEFHGGEDGGDPRPELAFDNSEDIVFTNDVTGTCMLLIAGEGRVKLTGDISGTGIKTMGTYFTRGRHRISATDAILPFSSVEEPGSKNCPILVLDEQTTYVIPADEMPGDFEIVLEPGAKVNFAGSSAEHPISLYRFTGNREDVIGYFTESNPKTGSVLIIK